jgi:hypothetical protein
MFFIHGKKNAKIKTYTDSHQSCENCKAFDLEIKVYKEYYHLYLIPFFPGGDKSVRINCKNCNQLIHDEALKRHYENITKVPFYLFSGPILLLILISSMVYLNLNTQKQKAEFLENPKVGDVYRIRKDTYNNAYYSFFKIIKISGDTVFAYPNTIVYEKFTVGPKQGDDYDTEHELLFLTSDLKKMLERREINSIQREDETN